MVDCYVGEVRLFAGSRTPTGWHLCDGTLVQINDYQTLFSLIGTLYGGDGATTFGLPDLRGRVPVGQGTGPSLQPKQAGTKGGVESVALVEANLPPHTHLVQTTGTPATTNTPGSTVTFANAASPFVEYHSSASASTVEQLHPRTILPAGNGAPHDNMMPTMVLNYIISLNGIYPSRP